MLRNAFENLFSKSDGEQIAQLLRSILDRLGYMDQVNGAMRVSTVVGSVITTITTVTSLSNMAAVGGFQTNNDQQVQFFLASQGNRSKITVS